MMDKKSLETIFGAQLIAAGFKKKASTWYRQAEGALQVVNLQKSSWGLQFYVNIGCVPVGMEVEGMPTPKEYKCPVRIRLASAFPEQETEIEKTFDLAVNGLSDPERAERLDQVVNEMVLPFMDSMKDMPSLQQAIDEGKFENAFIILEAQKYLGIVGSNSDEADSLP